MPELDERIQEMICALFQQNDLARTRALLSQVLTDYPAEAEVDLRVLELRGCVSYRIGDYALALDYLTKVLEARPDDVGLLSNIGTIYGSTQDHPRAIEYYKRALGFGYDIPTILVNLGNSYLALGQPVEALAVYRAAVAQDDTLILTHRRIAQILYDMAMYHEARVAFLKVVQLDPDDGLSYHTLGMIELNLYNDPKLALQWFERSQQLGITTGNAYTNYGMALIRAGKIDQALEFSQLAVDLQPSPHFLMNLSLLQLARHDWEAGFANFEQRLHISPTMGPTALVPEVQNLWDGQASLQDKVLYIRHEQGFGDIIQYCRFVRALRALGPSRIILETMDTVVPILAYNNIADDYTYWIDAEATQAALDAADYQVMLGSLPYLLRVRPDLDSHWYGPYLRAEETLVEHWEPILRDQCDATKLRVGIMWRGSPAHLNDRLRSTSLDNFRSLAMLAGVQLIALQMGKGVEQIRQFGAPLVVLPRNRSWQDTAAIIQQLDLVISVDTGLVHLAGALGKPCWVLVPKACDWRWGHIQQRSLWYPGTRIFRQQRYDHWPSVFQQAKQALRACVRSRTSLVDV